VSIQKSLTTQKIAQRHVRSDIERHTNTNQDQAGSSDDAGSQDRDPFQKWDKCQSKPSSNVDVISSETSSSEDEPSTPPSSPMFKKKGIRRAITECAHACNLSIVYVCRSTVL
jgi:hypothetical protein